jgi:hypothetical protein
MWKVEKYLTKAFYLKGTMSKIIERIFSHPVLRERPPVLIDIGASGEIHRKWKTIARYSICLAFDADDREMDHTVKENEKFKKLIVINGIVTDKDHESTDFYLTASPFCSSALEPDTEALTPWLFKDKFEILKKVSLKAVTLKKALEASGITYIDWFKTDTQGTDLRLYNSIPENIKEGILYAEFEPGLIDAYKSEDKLYRILEHFDRSSYWLAEFIVKGSQRLYAGYYSFLGKFNRLNLAENLMKSPGWGEIMYCRDFSAGRETDLRSHLLAYAFAITQRQYGYALEIAASAKKMKYDDRILEDLEHFALKKLKSQGNNIISAAFFVLKRRYRKLTGR